MAELIAEMRGLDGALADDDRLAEIRSSLTDGIDQLQASTEWLLKQGPLDPNAAGSASVNLLMLTGTVVGGWQMALAGLAIVNGAASDDPAFAEAKLITTRFYAQHILPRGRGLAIAAMAGPDAVMALSEDQF
jgi:hypothetical protein